MYFIDLRSAIPLLNIKHQSLELYTNIAQILLLAFASVCVDFKRNLEQLITYLNKCKLFTLSFSLFNLTIFAIAFFLVTVFELKRIL